MLDKIKRLKKDPRDIICFILSRKLFWIIPDKIYLKMKYRVTNGKKLNLKNPSTFSEKLQWLKLYDRRPEYIRMVDKYKVRNYIKKKIGEEYLIPLYGVYDHFDEIDFSKLPNQFVLKPNHTSGDIYICKDKNEINMRVLRKTVNRWMKRRYYWLHREWPYKYIKPKIICEAFITDTGKVPDDFKVLCFDGKAKLIEVHTGRFNNNHKLTTFTPDWDRSTLMHDFPPFIEAYEKPLLLDQMIELSEKLAANIAHIRVDWYIVDNKLYFGELTLYFCAGFIHYFHEVDDYIVGEWIKLPTKNKRGDKDGIINRGRFSTNRV